MFIEELIIEGFKSYANRTVIAGWDSEFNAITGLNGTGKSNILDAICFVLGIDNLRQVRATSLQDLVYKRGQAGISKASVSIVFNNEDPANGPIGYANCPQITITRQIILNAKQANGAGKYLINGHNAQVKAVNSLFQSVQLNINNPHFLIMQGQITRVLNMKAPEILAMVEESAGTRMFEDRKVKAMQVLSKKEKKVDEMGALLRETIEPKLEALRSERSEFIEFKRVEGDVERLGRMLAAFEFCKLKEALEGSEEQKRAKEHAISEIKAEITSSTLQIEKINDQMMIIRTQREKENQSMHKLKQLEEQERSLSNEAIKKQTCIDILKKDCEIKEEEMAKLAKDLRKEQEKLAALEGKNTLAQNFEKDSQARAVALRELERDKELLRSLETGGIGGGGGYESLQMQSKDKQAKLNNSIRAAELKQKQVQKELLELNPRMKGACTDCDVLCKNISKIEEEIDDLSKKLHGKQSSSLAADDSTCHPSELQAEKTIIEGEIAERQDELNRLQRQLGNFKFSFRHSDPRFDYSKVLGLVAEAVEIDENNIDYADALQVTAGGKLYNVITEDEATASSLLEKGNLTKRVTIIPLNKIQAKSIPVSTLKDAEKATRGKAKVALSLVGYASQVEEAMKFVFGSTFVCDGKEAAEMIAFDRKFGYRAVTKEGDVYEPSGMLSGGAKTGGKLLERLQEVRILKRDISDLESRLEMIEGELEAMEGNSSAQKKDLYRLRSLKQELDSANRRFELDPSGQLVARHKTLTEELSQLDLQMKEERRALELCVAEIKQYERENAEFLNDRDGKLDALSKKIIAAQKALDANKTKFETASKKNSEISLKIELCKQSSLHLIEAIQRSSEQVDEMKEQIFVDQEESLKLNTQLSGVRIRLDAELQKLKKFDKQLAMLEDEKKSLSAEIDGNSLTLTKLSKELEVFEKTVSESFAKISKLERDNGWIADNKDQFGVPGGSFDFKAQNMKEIRKALDNLKSSREHLRKNINFNVMDMIDRVESKEASLKQMVGTVRKDRHKIEDTIVKLNDCMLETLEKTWRKVNEDFGLIFGDLLPGSNARLDCLEDRPITDGLEIKVCLGGVWKSGLAELSGGQRSLVALSLILALLQFNPAPMYILDEVDAALDLSHTENIGRLLKSRFKGSQFIVVSLKEGMFENASVLFKTRFQDGVSAVDRIAVANETDTKTTKKLSKILNKNKSSRMNKV